MTYYEDLTPYEYFARSEPPGLTSLNVGWLSPGKSFSIGETSLEFKTRLFQFCQDENVVHLARGFHVCEFCSQSEDEWYQEGQAPTRDRTHWLNIGDGEIRVLGDSVVYAAPTLIYHYVVTHQYKPPDEFIQAVLARDGSPESEAFKSLLKKYD